MAKQRAHWCLTIPHRVLEHFSNEGRKLFETGINKAEGLQLNYNDQTTYKVVIGPKEGADDNTQEDHYHVLISNQPGKASTKGRCITVLEMYGMMCREPIYIQPLNSTVSKYTDYMFKTVKQSKAQAVDAFLSDTLDGMRQRGMNVTKEKFFNELLQTKGASWCTKQKAVIDTFTSNTMLFDSMRIIHKAFDKGEILERTEKLIESFYNTILANLNQHGYDTDHPAFQNIDTELLADYITIHACIPFLFQRCEEVDNMPALYLYGDPASGKSFLFNSGRCYKHIPSDASGVGRFKLDGNESAILMDDVSKDTIDDPTNIGTLRSLALGGTAKIKIHSDSKAIQAFVVITSNEKPNFLTNMYAQTQAKAWKRRFISIYMTQNNFHEFYVASGTEMDYQISQNHIAKFIMKVAKEFQQNDSTQQMYSLIKDYIKRCNLYVTEEELKEINDTTLTIASDDLSDDDEETQGEASILIECNNKEPSKRKNSETEPCDNAKRTKEEIDNGFDYDTFK
jgi:hypothetical protein